jgi:predicted transcriptional regulator
MYIHRSSREVLELPWSFYTPCIIQKEQNVTPQELVRIREGMGWTQTEAAAKAGVSANTWARWERGEVTPHVLRVPILQRLLRQAEKRATSRAGRAS